MKKFNAGFTLIELLVVVAVMGGLGLLFTDILTQTLRGQNKAKIINQVKQNGQAVLDKLTNDIRQAQEVKCATNNTIVYARVVSGQTGFTRVRFTRPTSTTNGVLAMDHPVIADQTSCDEPNLINPPENLTDTDPVNGVSIKNASFSHTLKSSSTDPNELISDTVTVSFDVTAGVGAGFAYETTVKEGGINYSTTIQLRDLR